MLVDFTSYAEIRAVLGVSATELPDSVLEQPQWETILNIELEEISDNLATKYAYIVEMYGGVFIEPPDGLLKKERKFYELTRLYAAYVLAKNLLTSLPIFSVQQLTDGRASFTRQTDIFADVRDGILGMCTTLKSKLSLAYLAIDSTATAAAYSANTLSYTVSTGLAISPITNS